MLIAEINANFLVSELSKASQRMAAHARIGETPQFEIYMANARLLADLAEAFLNAQVRTLEYQKKEATDAALGA